MSNTENDTGDDNDAGQDDDQSGSTMTDFSGVKVAAPVETEGAPAPVEEGEVQTPQPVTGPPRATFQTFEASTLVEELPEQEVIANVPAMYLLLNDRDDTHALTAPQMGVMVSHIKQNYGPGTAYGDAVADLRKKHLQGRQKDWNIVNKVSAESRQATAHEMMTEGQERMLYEAILPALAGRDKHWDPQIQANIEKLAQSTRLILLEQTLKITTRGEVSNFMKKLENLCGRPAPQQGRATGAATNTNTGVPTGAGTPGGGIVGGEEPF